MPPVTRDPHIETYPDTGGRWRWRYVAGNGRTMADSGQGYESKAVAMRACAKVFDLEYRSEPSFGEELYGRHRERPIEVRDLTKERR